MSSSRIMQLTSAIAAHTSKVDNYLRKHDLPQPSFDVNGPVELGLPEEIEEYRVGAIDASQELNDLLRGPIMLMRPVVNATSLQAIYRYDLASKVPLDGEISFAKLAELCDMQELDVRRIVRFAMSWHRCFCEPSTDHVAHTAASRKLAEDPSMRDGLGLMFNECWPSMARTVDAMQEFKSEEPSRTGFSLAHDTQDTLYAYLAKNPVKGNQFARAMRSFTSSTGFSPKFLADGYDWTKIGKGTVVDVGGGEGHIAIAVADRFPSITFIVQELASVVENAQGKVPKSLANRLKFMEHDFFNKQPISADVYLFREIFHNWPDTYCVKILRQLIPALKPGAFIVVMDNVIPGPGTISQMAEREIRAMDMLMLTLFNAREREERDWVKLFREADERFMFRNASKPQGSALGIIEIEWKA